MTIKPNNMIEMHSETMCIPLEYTFQLLFFHKYIVNWKRNLYE